MSGITVYQSDFDWAVSQGYISQAQAEVLWPQLVARYDASWRLQWVHLGYFLGGLLIFSSLTWFTNLAWQDPTGFSLLILSSIYVIVFGSVGKYIWKNQPSNIPQVVGGIFVTISVCLTPVIVVSLQRYLNVWETVCPGFYVAVTTFVVGCVAIYSVNFPFLTFPITLALYFLCEADLPPFLYGPDYTRVQQAWISVIFGLIMIWIFFFIEKKNQSPQDYSFWGYIWGCSAFWGGLTALYYLPVYSSQWFQLAYFLVNLALMALSMELQRNVFLIYGGLGAAYAIGNFLFYRSTVKANCYISLVFGLCLSGAAYYKSKQNTPSSFYFWAYLVGATCIFGGLTTMYYFPIYDSQLFKFIYFVASVSMMISTIWTQQSIFLIYGLLGSFYYVTDMVYIYYWNSYWLPFILTGLGLVLIGIAVWFSRHMKKMGAKRQAEAKKKLMDEENNNHQNNNNDSPYYYGEQAPYYYYPVPPQPYGYYPAYYSPMGMAVDPQQYPLEYYQEEERTNDDS